MTLLVDTRTNSRQMPTVKRRTPLKFESWAEYAYDSESASAGKVSKFEMQLSILLMVLHFSPLLSPVLAPLVHLQFAVSILWLTWK